MPILAPRTIYSTKNNTYMILAFLLCFSQMYNDHSFTFKSCIQIHLEVISYMKHYLHMQCSSFQINLHSQVDLSTPALFQTWTTWKKIMPKCLHLPSRYPSPSFCLYCNSSVLVSRSEFGCRESPDNGSNLTHDAMPKGQHRLTWSSLR